VKPQFEVGREQVGRGGVVREAELRASAIRGVAGVAEQHGFGVRGLVESSLPGPAGNVEYVLWLTRGAAALTDEAVQSVTSQATESEATESEATESEATESQSGEPQAKQEQA
jgi:23S rRNA (cytidine1920-2'-O)/16S rRNA (cytidine1409-2'-O)-methyltransferase